MRVHLKSICKTCGKQVSSFKYQKHTKICSKKTNYFCTFCNFQTSHHSRFKIHKCENFINDNLSNEIEEKRYRRCHICEFVAKNKSNLNRHVKMVHETMKYNCTYCKKKFNSLTVHDRHVAQAHMTENKKIKSEPTIYHCDKCKYKTKSKGNMKKHQSSQKHTLPKCEKPIHICQICKKQA